MVVRLHKKRIWVVLLFVLCWLQQVFLEYTSGTIKTIVGYTDELLVCIGIVMIILSISKQELKLLKTEVWLILFYLVFILCGIISTMVNPVQGWLLSAGDFIICSRFIVFYFISRIIVNGMKIDAQKLITDIAFVCRIFTIILFVLALHDLFLPPFFQKYDYRYFMHSLKLFFPHPAYMAVGCITASGVLMAASCFDMKNRSFNLICVFILSLLMCLTMRSKAIAVALCVVLFYLLLVKFNMKSKALLLGGGIILALIIGGEQILYYYDTNVETVVRARMHRDAVVLANESFPFGTGFATFGSSLAAENYSPIYERLGYGMLHGGSSENTSFLCDTFWPTVIAQFGWVGAIAFVGVVICFLLIVFRSQKYNKYLFWAMLSLLTYELFSSIADSAFFNPSASAIFAFLGIVVNVIETQKGLDSANYSEIKTKVLR